MATVQDLQAQLAKVRQEMAKLTELLDAVEAAVAKKAPVKK